MIARQDIVNKCSNMCMEGPGNQLWIHIFVDKQTESGLCGKSVFHNSGKDEKDNGYTRLQHLPLSVIRQEW